MGLKDNIAYAVFVQPRQVRYPQLRELFAHKEDAEAHLRYLKEHKRLKDVVYISPVPIQYGQVL